MILLTESKVITHDIKHDTNCLNCLKLDINLRAFQVSFFTIIPFAVWPSVSFYYYNNNNNNNNNNGNNNNNNI